MPPADALLVPTLADRLHAHGMEYVAIGTGTSGNAYVHNPNAATAGGATIHPQFTLPRRLHAELEDRFGEWPPEVLPNTARLNHGRRILTEYVLPEINPAVALLWLSEPDKTQHEDGVGLGRAPQALREADAEFGEVLSWLAQNRRSETTDILIASDHGYSTITEPIPIESMMRESGFPTVEKPGGVAVAGNGGSALFYVHENNPDTAETVAQWLTSHEWCGPLFASERVGQPSGTLPASLIGCDGPRAPDLSMSFRWDSIPNGAGHEGHAYATGGRAGQGQHGSMSRHELKNVGLAKGPSLRNGTVVETPTGNIDFAPTILHLLGMNDALQQRWTAGYLGKRWQKTRNPHRGRGFRHTKRSRAITAKKYRSATLARLTTSIGAIAYRVTMAEGVGFEPTRVLALPVFKTGAFVHSAIPPRRTRANRHSITRGRPFPRTGAEPETAKRATLDQATSRQTGKGGPR